MMKESVAVIGPPAAGDDVEFGFPRRRCPLYVSLNFFTTPAVLNTCLSYYLFLLYVYCVGIVFVKSFGKPGIVFVKSLRF